MMLMMMKRRETFISSEQREKKKEKGEWKELLDRKRKVSQHKKNEGMKKEMKENEAWRKWSW